MFKITISYGTNGSAYVTRNTQEEVDAYVAWCASSEHWGVPERQIVVTPAVIDPDTQEVITPEVTEVIPGTYTLTIEDNSAEAAKEYVTSVVRAAIATGDKLVEEFTVENIMMGITADNMTGAVLTATEKVVVAAKTGSLKEAIKRLTEIPPESYDAKYITEARLLGFANKVRTSLGLATVSDFADITQDL